MKRTKKLVSGLLVLMMLAGLGVMPVGATVDTTEYVGNTGGFEGTAEVDQDGVMTKIQGWDIKDASSLSVVKEGDAGYVGYGVDGTVPHGNYLKMAKGDSNGIDVATYVSLPDEETYEVTMRAYALEKGDIVRFNVYLGSLKTSDPANGLNSSLLYESFTGGEYWWTASEANVWKTVRFTLTIPKGTTGVTLGLRNPQREVYYDDLRITKATNLLQGYNFNETSYFDESLAVFRPTYEGPQYWFNTKAGTEGKSTIATSGEGASINGTNTLEQDVPVKTGKTYRLRTNAWANNTGGQMNVAISFAEKQELNLTHTFTGISSSSDAASSYHTYYFYVPDTIEYNGQKQAMTEAHIKFYCAEGTTIWFRWAELVEVESGKISFLGANGQAGEYAREISSLQNVVNGDNTAYTVRVMGEIENTQYGGRGSAQLLVGFYEGNQLKNIEIHDITCEEGDVVKSFSKQFYPATGQYIKAFLWGVRDLTPVISKEIR